MSSLRVVRVLALLPALVLGSTGARPAVAESRPTITYYAVASTDFISLCTGEREEILVGVSRAITQAGGRYSQWVPGGYVVGLVDDSKVGRFDPVDPGRAVTGAPRPSAVFTFVAESPGTTTIEFIIKNTGEEQTHGNGWAVQSDTVDVEVTDCYEASTSGLGAVFTENDMGGLDEPFFLSGYTDKVVKTDSQFMFFIPDRRDRLHGSYAFVDTAAPMAAPGAKCTAYISGTYEVVFHLTDTPRPVEGELMMKGSGVDICQGYTIPVDYTTAPGFEINFKPKAATGR